MAFLRKRRIGGGTYLYIIETRRSSGKVRHKILEYLGRNPPSEKVAKALEYWGIRKPKQVVAANPPLRMLKVHPLDAQPLAALAGRVVSIPLKDCPRCARAVKQYKGCIGQNCGSTTDLLTEHGHGGRLYCVRCFTPVVNDYEMVQRRVYSGPSLDLFPGKDWKDVPIPRWVRRSPREMMEGAHWPEQSEDAWQEWHAAGLRFVLMSGRVPTKIFADPPTRDGSVILKIMDVGDDAPWATRLAGYLLAGVGGEYLVKALYLKAGFSLRCPPQNQRLARKNTPEARKYNPYRSVSFKTMLRDDNLLLISDDPETYRWMGLAMRWRDQPAHSPTAGGYDWGGGIAALGATMRRVHEELLTGSDDDHLVEIKKIIADTKPIHLSVAGAKE